MKYTTICLLLVSILLSSAVQSMKRSNPRLTDEGRDKKSRVGKKIVTLTNKSSFATINIPIEIALHSDTIKDLVNSGHYKITHTFSPDVINSVIEGLYIIHQNSNSEHVALLEAHIEKNKWSQKYIEAVWDAADELEIKCLIEACASKYADAFLVYDNKIDLGKTIKLKGNDSETPIELPIKFVKHSLTIKDMIDDGGALMVDGLGDDPLPLHGLSKIVLERVVELLEIIDSNPNSSDRIQKIKARLDVKSWSAQEIYELLGAANYLDIEPLLNACMAKWVEISSSSHAMSAFEHDLNSHPLFQCKSFPMVPDLSRMAAQLVLKDSSIDLLHWLKTIYLRHKGDSEPFKQATCWDNRVHCVSRSGKLLAISYENSNKVELCNIKDGVESTNIDLQTNGDAWELCFSPNGNIIAGRSATSLQLWNVLDGSPIAMPSTEGSVLQRVCFSPDSKIVACTVKNAPAIKCFKIDRDSCTEHKTLTRKSNAFVAKIRFTNDGKLLVWTAEDNTLSFCNVDTGACKVYENIRPLSSVFSQNGEFLSVVHKDGEEIWLFKLGEGNVENYTKIHTSGGKEKNKYGFSADGKIFFAWIKEFGRIEYWDVDTGALINTLSDTRLCTGDCVFSSCGQNVVHVFFHRAPNASDPSFHCAASYYPFAGMLFRRPSLYTELPGYLDVSASPDGKFLACVPHYGYELDLIDIKTGTLVKKLKMEGESEEEFGNQAEFTSNNKILVLKGGGSAECICFWNLSHDDFDNSLKNITYKQALLLWIIKEKSTMNARLDLSLEKNKHLLVIFKSLKPQLQDLLIADSKVYWPHETVSKSNDN